MTSCVLSPPASEVIIFRNAAQNESNFATGNEAFPFPYENSGASDTFLDSYYILSATYRPKVRAELEYAKDKFSSYIKKTFEKDSSLTADNLIIYRSNYFSLSFPLPLIRNKNVYWFLKLGFPVIGTDVTFPIASNTYVTANLGYLDGEIIIQQKMLQTADAGLAIGGYYRAERRVFEIRGDNISLVPFVPIFDALDADRIFYNHIVGVRVNGYLSLGDDSNMLLRAAPGYALNLDALVLNLNLTLYFEKL